MRKKTSMRLVLALIGVLAGCETTPGETRSVPLPTPKASLKATPQPSEMPVPLSTPMETPVPTPISTPVSTPTPTPAPFTVEEAERLFRQTFEEENQGTDGSLTSIAEILLTSPVTNRPDSIAVYVSYTLERPGRPYPRIERDAYQQIASPDGATWKVESTRSIEGYSATREAFLAKHPVILKRKTLEIPPLDPGFAAEVIKKRYDNYNSEISTIPYRDPLTMYTETKTDRNQVIVWSRYFVKVPISSGYDSGEAGIHSSCSYFVYTGLKWEIMKQACQNSDDTFKRFPDKYFPYSQVLETQDK